MLGGWRDESVLGSFELRHHLPVPYQGSGARRQVGGWWLVADEGNKTLTAIT